MKRIGAATLATAVGVAAVVLATGQPALAADFANLPLSSWAYLDSQSPTSKFVNPQVAPPVGTLVDDANRPHTYRSYFTYDLTQLKGTVVHNSYLYTYEDAVTDCSTAVTIEVWRTAPVKAGTTWNNPPAELEKLISAGRGQGSYYCPGYLGFDMVETLNAALGRNEKSITVEYRITAAQEADPRAGRTFQLPTLSSTSNHPPTVSDPHLESPKRPCGTLTKPSPAAATTMFKATANDPDEGDYATVLYAIWPVDQPDQRREFYSYYGTDLSQYADGQLLAWQARASDYYDAGPWSKACYVIMDKAPPANPPVVTSKLYPEGNIQGGGAGVTGRFRVAAGDDQDVVAFSWRDSGGNSGSVKARQPGRTAVIEYTPKRAWIETLYVHSVDAAGNRGPEKAYQFWVADTAPSAEVEMGGVGLPSTISLTARKPETTAFGYQVNGGPQIRVPAVDGKATDQFTFTEVGEVAIVVSSYVKNKLIGQDTLRIPVTDSPQVESAEFNFDNEPIAGKTGSFTFKPRNADVVAYEYVLDNEAAQTVTAAADDTAVLPWTATAGWHMLIVWSVKADGSKSMEAYYQFSVLDPVPSAYAPTLEYLTRIDGVGLPVEFYLSSQLPNVTGFAYRFDGGPETVVPSYGASVSITVTPVHTGDNTLIVEALLADGTRSPAKSFTWRPFEAPVITTDPPGGGAAAQPMTLTFRSVLPDTREFRYSLDFGEYQTIAARPDGTATVSFTPQWDGWFSARVTAIAQDGTTSPEREMTVPVRDTRVSVWSQYNEWSPRGGIGVPGDFALSTEWKPEVVEYLYRLNDGPEQVTPIGDSWNTMVRVVPDRNGPNTLTVRGRTADGRLSPVTEYLFQVGTAPQVFSEAYPRDTAGGGVGVEGRFEFSGGTAGITSFEYTIGGVAGTVDADAEGRASITWTPTEATGLHLIVKGRKADGTTTDETGYFIVVKAD
ncbi:hypothetical protein [Micromonospora profundi]|uniref:hypothetical protein n=1 Tax=Micromonospora profundi TaxID=1420889 RepID=UPI00368960B7